MPRPPVDNDEFREQLLTSAENLLSSAGPFKLTVSAIAKNCGMSQSNAYRFFENKEALMNAIADRWFKGLEEALQDIVQKEGPANQRFREFLLTHYTIKRARFDENPALFQTYLDIGKQYDAAVQKHLKILRQLLRNMLEQMGVPKSGITNTTILVEDMTVPLRDPNTIAYWHASFDISRVNRLIDAVLKSLEEVRK